MDTLRKASFRGVEFNVTQGDLGVGRRTQTNEYPLRDIPFVEDLGRSVRTFSLSGFFVGESYLDDWQKLQKALETEGSGELIHPWLGRKLVIATGVANVSFSVVKNYIEFSVTFTESGELIYPNASVDTKAKTVQSAHKLKKAILKDFTEQFNLTSAQDFVKNSVAEKIKGFLSSPLTQLSGAITNAEQAAKIANSAVTLVSMPSNVLGAELIDALGLGDISQAIGSWRSVVAKAKLIGESRDLNDNGYKLYISGPNEAIEANASDAFDKLVRRVQVHNAVLATANIGTEFDRLNENEPVKAISYDEVIKLRDGLLETIDKEQFSASDEVFQALADCRSSVWADLSERAENNAKLFEYTPNQVMPSIVVAYEVYEDATRDVEIVERNHIARGGFVPMAPIKLLSE